MNRTNTKKVAKRDEVLNNLNGVIRNSDFESYLSYQAMINNYTVDISEYLTETTEVEAEVGYFDWTPSGSMDN